VEYLVNNIQPKNVFLHSKIGSPPCWTPPATIEEHRPLIFLDLDPVNMHTANDTAGLKATLNEENKNDMFRLPLLHHASDEVKFFLPEKKKYLFV
jgi:hypothetical protein